MTVKPETTEPTGELEPPYRESLDWLYRQSRGSAPRDPARMARLVEGLELDFPARAVHVVGTNGKGTVTSMCAAALAASGSKSGCFTSPHVEGFRERITVNGETIPTHGVVEFVERVRSLKLPLEPAFFELTLALALEHFKQSGVSFGAFEAGVGARMDATAVLEGVRAVALTPIALDHVETLGPTLRDIAGDKAASIRPGVPVASAEQLPEVLNLLEAEASDRGAPLHVDSPGSTLFEPPAGLALESDGVRRRNQRLAAATLRLLGNVPEEAVSAGLAIPPLPGRGERFRVGAVTVLLDGAHDPAAAKALVERAGREYLLLFGSLRRKQGEETLRALEPKSTRTFVTSAGGEPATVSATANRTFVPRPGEALRAALAACRPGDLLVIGGSLYLAGELRPLLRELSASVDS